MTGLMICGNCGDQINLLVDKICLSCKHKPVQPKLKSKPSSKGKRGE